ncbi:unnamed protein product [Prunus brigantina]
MSPSTWSLSSLLPKQLFNFSTLPLFFLCPLSFSPFKLLFCISLSVSLHRSPSSSSSSLSLSLSHNSKIEAQKPYLLLSFDISFIFLFVVSLSFRGGGEKGSNLAKSYWCSKIGFLLLPIWLFLPFSICINIFNYDFFFHF